MLLAKIEQQAHPIARATFIALAVDLQEAFKRGDTKTDFRAFEVYRSPQRQRELVGSTSNAGPWLSAHQYGLAVDFVPWDNGWSWAEGHDYEFLKNMAEDHGLIRPLAWDKVHVEHPAFSEMKRRIRGGPDRG